MGRNLLQSAGVSEDNPNRITIADLNIRTKDKKLIKFPPNSIQRRYYDEIIPRWREGDWKAEGLREILLKFRQPGLSTAIAAWMFLDTINNPHTQSVVICDDKDKTTLLFRIVKRFYDGLPAHKKPRAQYASKYEYYWPELDSGFFVGTAGSGSFGRSATINNVHGSEVAFWPDAENLISGLLQSVPLETGNVILETTANGIGNWFEKEYKLAERGQSNFKPRFYGWHEHDEYEVEPDEPIEPTKEEERLIEAYGLSDRKVAWRRIKKLEVRDKFPQEYPINPREAFISSGNPYFDLAYLTDLFDRLSLPAHEPLDEIPLPSIYGRLHAEFAVSLKYRGTQEEERGLTVWKAPERNGRYIISCDVAEGLQKSTNGVKHDFCAAQVLDARTNEQVALLHGKWNTNEYGHLLGELGYWYNTGLIVVERNNHGHSVLNTLMNIVRYPDMNEGMNSGIYVHQEYDDEGKPVEERRAGRPTDRKTKVIALDALANLLIERGLILHSKLTVSELMSFVKKAGGTAGAEGNGHDDTVMALGIGAAILVTDKGAYESEPRSTGTVAGGRVIEGVNDNPVRPRGGTASARLFG